MRGKSVHVGSGFCSRVSEESFSSISIADQERVWLGQMQLFRGRPGPVWASMEDDISVA